MFVMHSIRKSYKRVRKYYRRPNKSKIKIRNSMLKIASRKMCHSCKDSLAFSSSIVFHSSGLANIVFGFQ